MTQLLEKCRLLKMWTEQVDQMQALIPAALKQFRAEQGLGLREFGRRLGLSASYICDVENGNRRASRKFIGLLLSY